MRKLTLLVLIAACLFEHGVPAASAREPLAISGKIVDSDGKPLANAAVLVYSAGVREGFNLACPTCYADCGKRTFTNAAGAFNLSGLSPDLVFNLAVLLDGYKVAFAERVDPAKGPIREVVLEKHTRPADPAQIVRGRVVDIHGTPVPDALVEEQGILFPGGGEISGMVRDLITVTNGNGDFEIAYPKPFETMTLRISPRAMSARLVTEPSGDDRRTVVVTQGATVRGRLVQNGKPVPQVEVTLAIHNTGAADYLRNIQIGTNDEGKFAITNVPPRRVWFLYGEMDSLAPQGLATDVVECATKDDGQTVNMGDIPVGAAYTLRGKATLGDGKSIPPGMHVNITSARVPNGQTLILPPDGRFEFKGLARGVYEVLPAVKGYTPPDIQESELLIEGDVSDYAVVLRPESKPGR